jgi:urease accessory protein
LNHPISPAAQSAGSVGLATLALSALVSALHPAAALAHHPFGMAEGTAMSPWMGFVSGIGHPLLGPDHLLFLVAIGFVGLRRPLAWVAPLLAAGLLGSAVAQVVPLTESATSFAEALVSLSLVLTGLVALGRVPTVLLLPAIALHGYLLGGTVVGAEPTPLLTYFLGLLVSQGALLLVVTAGSRAVLSALRDNGRRVIAGIWIGIGVAFAWTVLIP